MAQIIPMAALAALDLLAFTGLASFWLGLHGYPRRLGANQGPAVTAITPEGALGAGVSDRYEGEGWPD